jgi:hypothetical protein
MKLDKQFACTLIFRDRATTPLALLLPASERST